METAILVFALQRFVSFLDKTYESPFAASETMPRKLGSRIDPMPVTSYKHPCRHRESSGELNFHCSTCTITPTPSPKNTKQEERRRFLYA